jgi:hypothetical protein
VVGLVNGDADPSSNAWNELNRFFDEAVVLDISTSLKKYTSMVLTDLQVVRNSRTAQGLHFTATAREVRFVDTQFAALIPDPVSTLGQARKSTGKKTNSDANAKQTADDSALFKTFYR